MKGPSGRLKFEVRRLWRCSRCQHTERLHARIVNHPCPKCSTAGEAPAWMTLIDEPARPRKLAEQTSTSQPEQPV